MKFPAINKDSWNFQKFLQIIHLQLIPNLLDFLLYSTGADLPACTIWLSKYLASPFLNIHKYIVSA
jgi:hypothetical protein